MILSAQAGKSLIRRVSSWNQGSSGRQRPCRPGFLKPSFPSLKSSQMSYFSSMAFVVGQRTSEIQSGTLRTVKGNLKIQDGEDVDVLRRPESDNLKQCADS